ncbi:MAG TPA: 6-carboxytetrahydropterin synthase [Pyrinomonadaceae bacterium]
MYEISKQFEFSASHRLYGLPRGHQCGRLHGHNYVVEIVLRAASLDRRSFVRDYGELEALKVFIKRRFDHRHLNHSIKQPTAENIARLIYKWAAPRWPETHAVRVSETPKTWATYREGVNE